MIFGIDHAALSGPRTPARQAFLAERGYRQVLAADDLDNPEMKMPWLGEYRARLALALFRAPESVGVEIVDHFHTHGVADRLLPVLYGDAPLSPSDTPLVQTPLGPAWWSHALGAGYVLAPGPQQPIRTFVWRCSRPEASARFWCKFGFAVDRVDSIDMCALHFRGMDRVDCSIMLLPAENTQPSRLDANGFTSLAFVTTSIERDLADLESQGVRVSPIASITPGDRPLKVGFAEGPDGELVELIGSPS